VDYLHRSRPLSEYREQDVPSTVVIAEYDPDWPVRFQEEMRLLQGQSGGSLHPIEHVGSTSVPALAAKPVVDILGGVSHISSVDTLIGPFKAVGYEYVPAYEDQMPNRRYFRKPISAKQRSVGFHLHIVEVGGDFWTKQLLFRDYLRANPSRANDYSSLKRRLAEEYRTDRLGYSQAKTEFILSTLKLAIT
jgi:GrpB-like predicted nucleotidyltransferase (UPF0157 family)